jgi:glutamate-5-semialdehyde dehydrogenase
MTGTAADCLELARRARAAARRLATSDAQARDAWLRLCAERLTARRDDVLAANEADLARAPGFGLSDAQLDRLRLTPARLEDAAAALRQVASLPDPLGRSLGGSVRPNGLEVRKVAVPIGVILFLYESRPNVTADAAALCVKSGNAVLLRGGKEAASTNEALFRVMSEALPECGLPADAVQLVSFPGREAVGHLLKLGEVIDLCIPRGGEGLIRRVVEEARMPVLKHYRGLCHVFVERTADLAVAVRVVANAKAQRPGVCNAAECLLVDAPIAEAFLPMAAAELLRRGVELRGCEATCRLVPQARRASPVDYDTEFLALTLSVRVVDGMEEALEHIAAHGSGHTDAILTRDLASARRFTAEVDSAAVMVNASTRFNDGGELGMGAEVGISTDKLHARGPCGLEELTTYKYIVYGEGQVRGE